MARQPANLSAEEIAWVRSMVIWQDSHLMAFNKPSGLSSQGGRGQVHTLDELLWAFQANQRQAAGTGSPPGSRHLRHHPGRKTKPAAGFLGKAIMARKLTKTYRAIVTPGAPDPAAGTIETPLRRDEQGREAYMRVCAEDHPDAEAAKSFYRTLKSGAGAALLELQPHTGRMHQLRVHLQSIGRPIAGDVRYGGALMVAGEEVPRLMLHAQALEFPHPEGGMKRVEADPPDDFLALAKILF